MSVFSKGIENDVPELQHVYSRFMGGIRDSRLIRIGLNYMAVGSQKMSDIQIGSLWHTLY